MKGFLLDCNRLRLLFINEDGMRVLKFCNGITPIKKIIIEELNHECARESIIEFYNRISYRIS